MLLASVAIEVLAKFQAVFLGGSIAQNTITPQDPPPLLPPSDPVVHGDNKCHSKINASVFTYARNTAQLDAGKCHGKAFPGDMMQLGGV